MFGIPYQYTESRILKVIKVVYLIVLALVANIFPVSRPVSNLCGTITVFEKMTTLLSTLCDTQLNV